MSGQFLIEKQGLYYRPDSAGYTGLKSEAGRFTFEEAAMEAGPNGPDGPQDGISIWAEDEAPDFSTRCPWEAKAIQTARKAALKDAIKAINAAREMVIHSGVVAYVDGVSKGHDRAEQAVSALLDKMEAST